MNHIFEKNEIRNMYSGRAYGGISVKSPTLGNCPLLSLAQNLILNKNVIHYCLSPVQKSHFFFKDVISQLSRHI